MTPGNAIPTNNNDLAILDHDEVVDDVDVEIYIDDEESKASIHVQEGADPKLIDDFTCERVKS